jgi:hypothetical protein
MNAQLHSHPSQPLQFAAPAHRFLPKPEIAACDSFRAAVHLAWKNRTRPNMTQSTLAEECGLYPPHVSAYLHHRTVDSKGNPRLNLPAEKIAAFEASVGNHAISQYLFRRGRLTCMEEQIQANHL